MLRVLTVTMNPALDREFFVNDFHVNKLHRIHSYEETEMTPGGKGINVSIALAKLGISSVALGITGGYTGRVVVNELRKISDLITTSFVHIEQETRENIAILDEVNHTITEINSPGPEIDSDTLDHFLKRYEMLLSRVNCVVLSGSLPRGVASDTYGYLVKKAKEKGKIVFMEVIDEYLQPSLSIACPHVLRPDLRAEKVVMGKKLRELEDYVRAAKELIKRGCELVVLSYKIKGDIVATKDEVWYLTTDVEIDSSHLLGIGDTYIAAMIYHRLNVTTEDYIQTAKFGYVAALAKTRKMKKEMPTMDEIKSVAHHCKMEKLE